MILPVCYKPEQDELLYGWLLGLAKANGIDSYNPTYSFINFFMKETCPSTVDGGTMVRIGYLPNLEMICKRYEDIPCFPAAETIMRYMTPLYTLFPLLQAGLQVRRSQYLLRENTGKLLQILPQSHDINELRVCPECMKEDIEKIGEAYYHTWHQLPEVRVCAKHHIPLMCMAKGKKQYLDIDTIRTYAKEIELRAPLKVEMRISTFMKAMYDSPLNIELNMTQALLLDKMADRGYALKLPYGNLANDLIENGYGTLFGTNPNQKISYTLTHRRIPFNGTIWLLSYFFENYEELKEKAAVYQDEWKDAFRNCIQGRFEVCSDFSQTVRLRCLHCGNEFFIHPYGIIMGAGCPECDKKLTEETIVNRMLSCLGDGQYELVPPSSNESWKVLHRTCGRVRDSDVQRIIYEKTQCVCSQVMTKDFLQERIDPGEKEFIVMDYKKQNGGEVTLLHKLCRKRFKLPLKSFEKNPYCRCCRPYRYSNEQFEKDISDLTGNAYEVVLPYVLRNILFDAIMCRIQQIKSGCSRASSCSA